MSERRYSDKYLRRRAEAKRRRKRRNAAIAGVSAAAAIVVVIVAVALGTAGKSGKQNEDPSKGDVAAVVSEESAAAQNSQQNETGEGEADGEQTEADATTDDAATRKRNEAVKEAEALAVQYDYDGALKVLDTLQGTDGNEKVSALKESIKVKKDKLVATSPQEVTHVFFHSLIADPSRGFSLTGNSGWDAGTPGFCQWMTTVSEFDKMMEEMYKNGYVLVSLYDMVDISTDDDGTEYISPKDIYLPEGKKPFVMSVDDVSYYHSYDNRGCASKMIVGKDGKPTCEYIDGDGKTLTGSYDCVPRLDDFLEKHPDFSYKGAKGTIALTGYNGILGYRTDYCYRDGTDLLEDQEAWLKAHPEFDWDKECAEAKKVADAIKEDGWTFASHTWGHIRIGDSDMERIRTDTEKWLERVAPLVGGSDIIVFAHGQDLSSWDEEYSESDKFKYMKSKGFSIFCNVDSSKYFVQIGDEYLRMGRRNLDGIRLWQAVYGGKDYTDDLFDASSVIDPERPTDAALYKN